MTTVFNDLDAGIAEVKVYADPALAELIPINLSPETQLAFVKLDAERGARAPIVVAANGADIILTGRAESSEHVTVVGARRIEVNGASVSNLTLHAHVDIELNHVAVTTLYARADEIYCDAPREGVFHLSGERINVCDTRTATTIRAKGTRVTGYNIGGVYEVDADTATVAKAPPAARIRIEASVITHAGLEAKNVDLVHREEEK